jgi:Lrp/AsnC family transcriptional regulator, leucine-responsive regulatory protein
MELIDDIDRRILNQLQSDCSLTNQDLAGRVHVSPPTCLRRVRRLVDTGVIERRIAIVSPQALPGGLTAIVEVTLERQSAEALEDFERKLVGAPPVQQCYRVSAGPDFILIVYVADMTAYHAFAHQALTSQANVRNVRSFFSTQRTKFAPAIAL